MVAVAGLNRKATRLTRGAISLSSSSHLPAIVGSILMKPVTLPPGRGQARDEAAADRIGNGRENDGDGARLLQQRRSGGCVLRKNEVGLQRDEFLRESLSSTPRRRMPPSECRSGCCGPPPTRASAVPRGTPRRRPVLPGRSRHSAISTPIRRIRSSCCARAASGHAAAARQERDELASSHSMTSSHCLPRGSGRHRINPRWYSERGGARGQPMSALGQKRTYAVQQPMSALLSIATAKADSRKTPCPLFRKRTCAVQLGMSALCH